MCKKEQNKTIHKHTHIHTFTNVFILLVLYSSVHKFKGAPHCGAYAFVNNLALTKQNKTNWFPCTKKRKRRKDSLTIISGYVIYMYRLGLNEAVPIFRFAVHHCVRAGERGIV